MSKRFGRNQKRRMREALAAEQVAREMDRGLLQWQSQQLRDAETFARDVAAMVGRESIIAGEPVMLDHQMPQGADRVRVIPRVGCPSLESMMSAAPLKTVRYETLRLLDVDVVRNNVNCSMHALVTLADEKVAYGISEHAMQRMATRDLERLMIPAIARQLAGQLKARFASKKDPG